MALTWRNVDAPNLSQSALAVGQAFQQGSQGLNDLAAGLGQFNQARQDRADSAAVQAAGRFTNSADYARALADGTVLTGAGIDPNMISGKAAQLLSARQNDLLNNEFNQAQVANQVQDNDLALKRFGLDEREFQARQEQNVLKNEMTQYGFNRAKVADQRADQQYDEGLAAQQLAYDIQNAGVDAAGARKRIRESGASDRVQAAVSSMLKLGGGGIVPTAPTANTGLTGPDAVFGHGIHGSPEVRLSQGNFGTAYDYGQQQIQKTKGKLKDANGNVLVDKEGNPLGTSAVGAYQFIGKTMETYAKKVFGDNWREVPFNFENQSKIAEALFNDSKDGDLKAIWQGLPDSTPGAYKNMSFEEFQREVLPRESQMTLDQIRASEAQDLQNRVTDSLATSDAVRLGMEGGLAQRLGSIDLDQFFKDSNNTDPDLAKAADKAIKSYPALKGTDLNIVAKWVDRVVQRASAMGTPITPAQGVHVLGASMKPSAFFSTQPFHPFNGAESGMYFDESVMDKVLTDVSQGGNIGRSIVTKQRRSDIEQNNNATVALQAAVKHSKELQARVAQGLPVAKETLDAAADSLTKALKRNDALNEKFADPAYQQKITESDASIAEREAAAKQGGLESSRLAVGGRVPPAPATPVAPVNRAAQLLEQRLQQQ